MPNDPATQPYDRATVIPKSETHSWKLQNGLSIRSDRGQQVIPLPMAVVVPVDRSFPIADHLNPVEDGVPEFKDFHQVGPHTHCLHGQHPHFKQGRMNDPDDRTEQNR